MSRGQTLVAPETLTAVTSIDVEAWLMPGSSALKHGSVVHFHAFTSNTLASVLLYGRSRFEAGASRLLRIKLQRPILLTAGDPFVLRQVSPPATVGGGRVLDAHPVARLRKSQAMAWLESLRSAPDEERLFLRVARRGTKGLSLQHLMAETGLAREAAVRRLQPLILSHRLLQIPGELLLAAPALDAACETIGGVLLTACGRSQTIGAQEPDFAQSGDPRFFAPASCQRKEAAAERRAGLSGGGGQSVRPFLKMQTSPRSRPSTARLGCLLP